ncbi:MAG: FecR domain-containing protein [Polyangiaceae bacterium]
MKAKPTQARHELDVAIRAVRADEPTPETIAASRDRVHARLFAAPGTIETENGPIAGCEGIQGLLPSYRRGSLSAARTLLVRGHLAECANCRELYARRGKLRLATTPWKRAANLRDATSPSTNTSKKPRALMLLAAAVTLAASFWFLRSPLTIAPDSRLATVQAINGTLYRIDAAGTDRLTAGATVSEGELVRAGDTPQSVLELADGSAVELGERAEFSIESERGNITLRLNRGQIIIQATKPTTGRLYVATRDCRVAVTGTVASVMTDVKGSRVSVLEGQAQIAEKSGKGRVLSRGEQLTTSPTLALIPIEREIAWSRNLDEHLALLHEMTELGKRWKELPSPALRYESPLFDWAPETAFLYAALPNYGSTLNEGYRLFRTRLDASPVLRKWWDANRPEATNDRLDAGFAELTELSSFLGDELVLTASRPSGVDQVVALAKLERAGLPEWLDAHLTLPNGDPMPLSIVDPDTLISGTLPTSPDRGALLLVTPVFVALSTSSEALRELAMRFSVDDRGAFATTQLGQRVASAYGKGVGLLVAADLKELGDAPSPEGGSGNPAASAPSNPAASAPSNPAANTPSNPAANTPSNPATSTSEDVAGGLRFVEFEHEEVRGQTVNSGVLTFADPGRGAAAWLSDPAPMSSLDFLTAETSAVAAFLVRRPAAIFGEIFRRVPTSQEALKEFPEFEGIWDARMTEDLAEALGAEFAVALDGPMLPLPSWKLVVEVRDPKRMELALERWTTGVSESLKTRNAGYLSLEQDRFETWTFHHLAWIDGKFPIEIHYAFVDGYFVATPTRALLTRAIEVRTKGDNLLGSPRFTSALPRDERGTFSGLVYQNLAAALAKAVVAIAPTPAPDGQRSLEDWAQDAKPSLVAFYAASDRIEMVGSGELFSLGPEALALPALLKHILPESVDEAKP